MASKNAILMKGIMESFNKNASLIYGESLDISKESAWLADHWYYSIGFAALYVIAIFLAKNFMESRKRFELRGALFLWNVFLAIFSFLLAFRLSPAIAISLQHVGFVPVICEITADILKSQRTV